MKYSLKELVDISKLQELTDEMYMACSIPSSIITMDGDILTASGWQRICTDFHRQHPQLELECIESDTRIRNKLDEGQPFAIYKCPRGLVDASSPIIIAGEHVANVFSGQVLLESPDENTELFFREQARRFNFDETKYIKAFQELPVFTEISFRAAINFLTKFAQMIAEMGLAQLNMLEAIDAQKESDKKYSDLVDSMRDWVWSIDTNGINTFTNGAIEQLLGYKPKDFINISAFSFIHPEAKSKAESVLLKSVEQKIGWTDLELKWLHKDGSSRYFESTSHPNFDDKGNLVGFSGVDRDITQRKRIERRLQKEQHFLRKAQEIGHIDTWELDIEKNELFWTDKNYNIFGLPIGTTLTYETFLSCVHPDDREYVDTEWKASFSRKTYDIEHRLLIDNQVKWVREKAELEFNRMGKCIRGTGFTQDITTRKLLEEQAQQQLIVLTQPDLDIADLSLHDILGLDLLQRLQDSFSQAFRISSIIYGPNGTSFTKPSCFTSFFQLVRSTEKGMANCDSFDKDLMSFMRNCQTPHIRKGCALKNTVTGTIPIIIQGQHLANWSIGQLIDCEVDPEEVRQYARTIGVDEEELVAAARELVVVGEAAFLRIVNFVKTLSDQIGLLALQNLQQGQEISRRMRAEEALKESKIFLDNLTDIAYLTDTNGNMIWANSAIEEISDFSMEEIIGQSFMPLIIEGDHASLMEVYQRTLDGESLKNTLTFSSGVTCDFTSLPRRNSAGEIIGTFGIARDITSRLRVDNALQISQERLNKAQRVFKIGNWEYDISTGAIWGSEEAFKIYGIERNSEFLALDEVEENILDAAPVHQALADLINHGQSYDIEYMLIPESTDKTITIHSVAELILDADGNPLKVCGVIQDITDSKAKEKEHLKLLNQLQQAQKMEAVGTLAGGIAHDFNNILAAISGYSELALDDALEGKATPQEIRMILAAAGRAKDLVQQILAFSRKVESEKKPLNLNKAILATISILERTIPKMISVESHLDVYLNIVNCDPNQFEQVLLNLASNAKDAMPDGGKLIFETSNVSIDNDFASEHLGAAPGKYVLVTVSDTGMGIDNDALEHIFEPFYTTKDVGKGTGLGLASVYGIIKSHHGYISCYSEPNTGTIFKIYFPTIELVENRVKVNKLDADLIIGGKEVVLIVDDENTLREVCSRILERQGYQVLTASSGEQALDIYRQKKTPIDLVILDINMPGMGGQKALKELLSINPQAKVVIASGYSANGPIEDILKSGAANYIAKPFKKTALLKTVREVIDS